MLTDTPLVVDIRQLIDGARLRAAVAVNAELALLYWQSGQRIRQDILGEKRADYGEKIVAALARQLTLSYGRGWGQRQWRLCIRFAQVYRDLANAFFRAGLVESWGRGIERMLETCRQAGLDDPVFAPESTGVWVTFNFAPSTAGRPTQETAHETTQELSSTTQEGVCLLLQGEPRLTRRELAERLSLTPDGVKYHLQKLKAMGRVRHVGPTRAGHWEVLK